MDGRKQLSTKISSVMIDQMTYYTAFLKEGVWLQ